MSLPKNKWERNEDEGRENMAQKKVGKEKDEGKEKRRKEEKGIKWSNERKHASLCDAIRASDNGS